MTQQQSPFPVNLFYSYCHKDQKYRKAMEKSLALLKQKRLLKDWSDQSILPGEKISSSIREKMDTADIVVFLLSQNFIASTECMEEWQDAKNLAGRGRLIFRVPIILEDCAWQDMLEDDDIKALPEDGKPVVSFDDEKVPWHQVYEGIKGVINQLRKNFSPKQEFLEEIEKTDFISQQRIKLQEIFVFLPLSSYAHQTQYEQALEENITSEEQLLEKKYILIHGEDMSGKTALGRYLFLSLINKSAPVLHVDLKKVHGTPAEKVFIDMYHHQFNGDYSLWKKGKDKILILDNLSSAPSSVDFILLAKDFFDKIIITLHSDVFISYFRDEARLADFLEMKINPLTHIQQEKLIRKRWELSESDRPITDHFIDQIENSVNSVMTHKIVPRYPFYVLSILQTFEGYMPNDLSITSHGHCYFVLIIANLIKAGISRSDDAINTCFNFAEYLAFTICEYAPKQKTSDFNSFVREYKKDFVISDSILSRIKHQDYGIITENGHFKTPYMHYFFLGTFLSKNSEKYKEIIEKMCAESYVTSNYLTLLFVIHHTNDNKIIEDILIQTMCTLDAVHPAKLSSDETKRFAKILTALSSNIISDSSVESERNRERSARDISERQTEIKDEVEQMGDIDPVNNCYRILKNNEILGQVLRNKYGNLEKQKIKEIIEIIADSGLRVVNIFFKDEKEIEYFADYLCEKLPGDNINKIENFLRFFSFMWTIINIEKVVAAINHPKIREIVDEVVQQRSTPAYDLIGYFSQLDSSKEGLTENMKDKLAKLLNQHSDPFIERVLSIRTQHYMNTHHSRASIEQSVCSLLKIKYIPKHRHLE